MIINLLDYANDKSTYPAQGVGQLSGLIGMKIWLFPLAIWTGVMGFFLTLGTIAGTTFVTLIVTGYYKRNEQKIQDNLEKKISKLKFRRNGKPKKEDDNKAA